MDVKIVCVAFLVSKEYSITSDRHQSNPSMAINTTAVLVIPQTQNIAGGKISGFEREPFTRQYYPDSNVVGFEVPTVNSGFKISGDMNKLGSFHFGLVHLCVNGKTNPVLKCSGFITNPEQFPLV